MTHAPIKIIVDDLMFTAPEQEVFDFIAQHLLRQFNRSTELGGKSCFYRGPGALKCAIGVCISDERFVPMLEGKSVQGIAFAEVFPIQRTLPSRAAFLSRLQGIHDNDEIAEWINSLRKFASAYELEFNFHRLLHAKLIPYTC